MSISVFLFLCLFLYLYLCLCLCVPLTLLPSCRFENTIGMVIERLRHKHESDGLRYFVGEGTEVLYEEYFHCKDLGSELVPVINRYPAAVTTLLLLLL